MAASQAIKAKSIQKPLARGFGSGVMPMRQQPGPGLGFRPGAMAQDAQQPAAGLGFNPGAMVQAQALNQQPDSIPAMMKPGEYVLPPDTVAAMGGPGALDAAVAQTHVPGNEQAVVPRGFGPRMFFANGGAVLDQKRPNWTFYKGPPAVPQAPQIGANPPGTAVTVDNRPNFTMPQNEPPRPSARNVSGAQDVKFVSDRGPGNPNVPAGGSAEARAFRAQQAAGAGPQPVSVAPLAASAPASTTPARNFVSQVRSALPQKTGWGVRGLSALSALPEALDTAKVAMDKESTGLDVATQAAEGAGRFGAATAGAAGGAKAGALAGALVPIPGAALVGGAIGGLAGGWAGYTGADKAIRAGREALGVDAASPVSRVDERQNTEQAAANRTPQTQSLVNAEEMQRRAADQPAQAVPTQPQVRGLPGVYQHGPGQYSDNAQGMGFAPGFTGQPSAQNMQAANALAGQQQAQSLGRVAAQQQAQQQGAAQQPRGFAAPQIAHSGNDFTARQNLRGLKMDAEWAMQRAPRKKYAMQDPAVMAYQAALQGDTAARYGGQAALEAKTNDTNAGLQREQMQQQGANQRDAGRLAIDQQRLGMDAQRLGLDAKVRGFDVRAAQRRENAQKAWQKATPDQRSVMREQFPDLFDSKEPKPFGFDVVRGSVDPSTGKREGDYAVVFDPNTGKYQQVLIGGSAAVPPGMKPVGTLDF